MNERLVNGFVAMLVFCGIVAYFAYTSARENKLAEYQQKQAESERILESRKVKAQASLCGRVNNQCEAKRLISLEVCGKKEKQAALAEAIPLPLNTEGCSTSEDELLQLCPEGCKFDSSSLLVISGKTEFDKSPKRTDGKCDLLARRPVSLSGVCLPN